LVYMVNPSELVSRVDDLGIVLAENNVLRVKNVEAEVYVNVV